MAEPPQIRVGFAKLLPDVLDKHVVVSHVGSERVHKVTRGNGMRVTCNGEIADACLAMMAEQENVRNAQAQAANLKRFLRYMDDMLFAAPGPSRQVVNWWNEYKRDASFSRATAEGSSATAPTMLNITISKGGRHNRTGKLHFKARVKKFGKRWL